MTEGKISFVFLLHFRALIPSPALSPGLPQAPEPRASACPMSDLGLSVWSLDDILPPEEVWSVLHGDMVPIPSTATVSVCPGHSSPAFTPGTKWGPSCSGISHPAVAFPQFRKSCTLQTGAVAQLQAPATTA